ncbi:3505_t:CDS:2 [Ambispora gerdemannii]|uniref:3505_t:CDS:1 n=1 Tax=Ambispora gerdemannii TaxID=144530 RepID=A0A9N9CZK9_9GLOM|nr:3505_t:CDS:2 [Ambispora gerdemannii]
MSNTNSNKDHYEKLMFKKTRLEQLDLVFSDDNDDEEDEYFAAFRNENTEDILREMSENLKKLFDIHECRIIKTQDLEKLYQKAFKKFFNWNMYAESCITPLDEFINKTWDQTFNVLKYPYAYTEDPTTWLTLKFPLIPLKDLYSEKTTPEDSNEYLEFILWRLRNLFPDQTVVRVDCLRWLYYEIYTDNPPIETKKHGYKSLIDLLKDSMCFTLYEKDAYSVVVERVDGTNENVCGALLKLNFLKTQLTEEMKTVIMLLLGDAFGDLVIE